jgi:cobalamin biosynthesis Mg chelatase CobN
LLNSDCTANTAAQTALNQWLTFLVNQGQSDLPAGMAPMPSTLVAQATAAIAKVGAAAPACTPAAAAGSPSSTTSPGSTPSPSSTPSGSSAVSPYALGSSDLFSDASAAGNGSTSSQASHDETAGVSPTPSSRAAALSLAAFGTVSANGWALPLLAILVLTVLLPGLVLLISGRSLSQALGGPRSQAQPAVADVPPAQEGLGET